MNVYRTTPYRVTPYRVHPLSLYRFRLVCHLGRNGNKKTIG
jgi:hypothetical protein